MSTRSLTINTEIFFIKLIHLVSLFLLIILLLDYLYLPIEYQFLLLVIYIVSLLYNNHLRKVVSKYDKNKSRLNGTEHKNN